MKHRGFTLIELMITIAIIAILATIAYPSYRSYIMRSHRAEAKSALLQVQVAQEKFFLQNNRYAYQTSPTNELTASGGAGLGIPATTANGYYTLSLAGTATTYTATATATGGQAGDSSCRTLSITHTGVQTATNSSSAASTVCWK